MINAAVSCFLTGAALIVVAVLIRDLSRIPALLRRLEEDRKRLENATPYTGPIYSRRGNEIEGN